MKFEEISRDEWVPFCNAFSRRHEGWVATLTLGGDEGLPVAESLPLVGVTAEMSRPGEECIVVTLGPGPDEGEGGGVIHVVRQPRRVEIGLDDAKKPAALRVEGVEAPKVLLSFVDPNA